jgi:hypothetical protein
MQPAVERHLPPFHKGAWNKGRRYRFNARIRIHPREWQ